jgi:SAM-dependent methyltransferase
MKMNGSNINSHYNNQSILEFLESRLELLKGEVLDIGCSRMKYKELILSGKHATRYIGLDLYPGQFDYVCNPDVYWDGKTMPFQDASLDSAILLEVLEHCDDPRIVVKEAFRVLKPGGHLLFTTPFLYQLHSYPYDYQRITPSGLNKLMSDAGFSKVEVQPNGSWDAALGQMISIWITHRPMPYSIRKFLSAIFVPVFKLLIRLDRKRGVREFSENLMMVGNLGVARK